jgi:gas vesicle protein
MNTINQEITQETFTIINYFILAVIVGVIAWLYYVKKDDESGLKSLPSIYTILGVFGTFLGISIGLSYFDSSPAEIENSVSFLLTGMQTAFFSSVAGMAAAVGIRIRNIVKGNKEDNLEEADKVIKYLKSQTSSLKAMEKGLSGDEEGSLLGQFKLLRNDFGDFAKKQAKVNMEMIQESLENVIADFNKGMKEQFGENFKELNKAVFKLVEWQENYYKQIEYMVKTIEQTNSAVENSKQIIQDISEKYADTYKLTEDFDAAIKILNDENKILMDNIENFSKLANEATNAMPLIEKQLTDLTTGFTATVEGSLGDIKNSSKESSDIMSQAMKDSAEGMTSSIKSSLDTIKESTDLTNTEIKKTVKSSTDEINSQLTELYKSSFQTLEKLQAKMADDLNKNINDIDNQVGSVVQNSMNSLSSNLVTVSSRFVDDYLPLTDRLREIVRIAESVEFSSEKESSENNES